MWVKGITVSRLKIARGKVKVGSTLNVRIPEVDSWRVDDYLEALNVELKETA